MTINTDDFTQADWKGDTAKGAAYLAEHRNDYLDKPQEKRNPFAKRGIGANISDATDAISKIDPNTRKNRIGLVCDDSGSMSGESIINAHLAVTNFTANCKPLETSICIYPLNAASKPLTCDFDLLNMYWNSIGATGGTPLYTTLKKLIKTEEITRAVVFSDGDPTDDRLKETSELSFTDSIAIEVINLFRSQTVAIDTIFIGQANSSGYDEMKKLAELTGGIFIHFTDSKSLTQNLKYLTPGLRGLLVSGQVKL
jgi:hypothetical protein